MPIPAYYRNTPPPLPPLSPRWANDTRTCAELQAALRNQVIINGTAWLRRLLWRLDAINIRLMNRDQMLRGLQDAEVFWLLESDDCPVTGISR